MPDDARDLERIEAFGSALDALLCERVSTWTGGRAYTHGGLPKIWDLNFLEVTGGALGAEEIAAAADEILGANGCDHRRLKVPDPELGASLEPGLVELGWEPEVHVLMAHRRAPNRKVDTSAVKEIGAEAWPGREEQMKTRATSAEELRQMRGLYDLMVGVGGARDLAIVEDGRAVSYALLFSDGKTGQIEDVATLEPYRNRGYSWRVVAKALELSEAEHDLTFLIADDRDWPKDFYSKVGFDPVGRHYFFLTRPQEAKEPA